MYLRCAGTDGYCPTLDYPMSRSETTQSRLTEMPLPQPVQLISWLRRTLCLAHDVDEAGRSVCGKPSTLQCPNHPSSLSHLGGRGSPAPCSDGAPLCQHCVQMAQELRSPLPTAYGWLNPADVRITSEHPVGAGGFANIWEGVLNGRKVAVKSYRCYESFDQAQVVSVRFCRCSY